jgi:ATP-binding protein involved in chromosome partitioning
VTLGYPAAGMQAQLTKQLSTFLGVDDIELDIGFSATPGRGFGQVKNVVLVSSGKGGVGKSTTAVNLALALDAEGAKVGLLDADIYGPSQGMMLGVAEGRRPDIKDGKFFEPIRAHGLKAMSMSFMITDKTPVVWRGPMASGALQQILGQTLWGDLDYLIVDMPPGTGDIQLTLSQKAPVAGAVIVTTPQDIALLDALKGIEMFAKVDIPVLGILENMSVHQCDNCGHLSHLFGEDGGKRVAQDLGVPLLGQLPLAMSIREQADGGHPTVKAEPDSIISELYRDAARNMAARLWGNQGTTPTITMVDD